MRTDRQAGITIIQLLLVVALVWGFFTFAPQRYLPALGIGGERGVGAQAYFIRVLDGIENSRRTEPGNDLPVAQGCATLTPYQPDQNTVASCLYQPSANQDFYTVRVTSKTGEVFQYSGRGR